MTRPYSLDPRLRAVLLVEAGQSRRAVARLLNLGEATVIRWMQRQAAIGDCAAKPMGGVRHAGCCTSGTGFWPGSRLFLT